MPMGAMGTLPDWLVQLGASALRTGPGRALLRVVLRQLYARGVPAPSAAAVAAMEARAPGPDSGVGGTNPFVWLSEPVCGAELPGPPRGEQPLAGWRLAVKDNTDVAGVPTGNGGAGPGPVAREDAAIVARLRAAGAVVVGKTQMCEWGVGGLGAQARFSTLDHPVVPGHLPGGSSSGTAVALAHRLADVGLGSDALGSVRIPAALCGLVGLKPTLPRQGEAPRMSHAGYHSVAPSLDTPGPMARTVEACAAAWQVLSGQDVAPIAPALPKRVGRLALWAPAAPGVMAGFEAALDGLGVEVQTLRVPGAERAQLLGALSGAYELARALPDARHLLPETALVRALGEAVDDALYARIIAERETLRRALARVFEEVGLVALPTTAIPAPARTREVARGGVDGALSQAVGAYTPLANVTGFPALAVPIGVDARGRPLSLMWMGPPESEDRLLAAAAATRHSGVHEHGSG